MKQMGMSQETVDASKVTIEKTDGKKIVFSNPSVTKMNIQGQEMFQISGNGEESTEDDFSDEDVKTVMEKTKCTKKDAVSALKVSDGNLAEAIISLSKG